MTIHVIVPVHNRLDMTRKFMDSLNRQVCSHDVKMIVVDDGSTDGTREYLAATPGIRVLHGSGSWWWAGCVQRAMNWIRDECRDEDWIYLGNNDTVLEPDHFSELLRVADSNTVVGSVAIEVWADGTRNPVSAGFLIDPERLTVVNAGMERRHDLDGLAGRGLLIPASALPSMRFHPKLMPQHFADLAFTAGLRRAGFNLAVATSACSTQLARAGSSVEFEPRLADALSRRSQLFLPALWTFWWSVSSAPQRFTLPARFLRRGFRQVRAGSYA
jgi:N-acetylglucosaminyl-diphospho-decaprenol L-rhamnosyltransferase